MEKTSTIYNLQVYSKTFQKNKDKRRGKIHGNPLPSVAETFRNKSDNSLSLTK